MYGWSEGGQKWRSWGLIHELGSSSTMPWILLGDFYEVLFEAEKKGWEWV